MLRRDCEDAEAAAVEAPALRQIERRSEHVGIVRHHHEKRAVDLTPVRRHELEVEGLLTLPQQVGEHPPRRLGLRVPVPMILHDDGVDAERDVVQEVAVVHRCEVDTAFDGITERADALAWVPSVQPEIEGKVVPGPRRHADEGQTVLDGDRRHQCLRTVAARHPETVRSSRDCSARQVGQLDAVVE